MEVIVGLGRVKLLVEGSVLMISNSLKREDTVLVVDMTDDAVDEGRVILELSKTSIVLVHTRMKSGRKQTRLQNPSESSVIRSKIREIRYTGLTTVIVGPNDAVGQPS